MNAPTTVNQTTGEIEQRDRALEVALAEPHPLKPAPANDYSPRSFDEAIRFCDWISESEIVPKDYQRKPANCFVAIQAGAEIGLKPIQSLWNIAVINGRPALWGDAQLALVRSSPHCEYVEEEILENGTAVCRAKRRGEPREHVVTFSVEDQKLAGLLSKAGPHTQYPKRMRQLRARGFALRDKFADVLKGIPQAEEMLSIIQTQPAAAVAALPRNATPAQIGATAAASTSAPERTAGHATIIADLEVLAFNRGSEALAEAWKALTKPDRTAIGRAELERLKGIAKECDDLAAAARAQAEADAAGAQQQTAEPGDGE